MVGLADLYAETLNSWMVALLVLAGLVLAVSACALNSVDATITGLAAGPAGVAVIAHRLARRSMRLQITGSVELRKRVAHLLPVVGTGRPCGRRVGQVWLDPPYRRRRSRATLGG